MNMITRNCEFRAASNDGSGDGRNLSGYAAVFDTPTEINNFEGRFNEQIARGAFRKTLQGGKKPAMQWQHGRDSRVGQVPIGVFTGLSEDDHGLAVEGRLFDNAVVEPVRQAIESGAVSGMSFSFRVVRDEWRDKNGKPVKGDEIYRLLYEPGDRGPLQRTIKEIQLFEAGPVLTPAYASTSVGVRSADELSDSERQAITDEYLRTMAEIEDDREPWQIKGELGPETVSFRGDESVIVDVGAVQRWLDAENLYRWLEAETYHRDTVLAYEHWLTAEQTHLEADAAQKSTSPQDNPVRDAARKSTSQREPKKVPEQKAPKTVRTRAMTLNELKEALATAEVRAEELDTEFRDAEMPEAEEREYDQAKKDVDTYTARIAKVEKRLEEMKGAPAVERGTDAGRTPVVRKVENIYDIASIRQQAYNTEDLRSLLRDNAMRAVESAKYTSSVVKEDSQDKVARMLDSIDDDDSTLAKRLLITGSPAYERAWGKAVAAGNPNIVAGEEYRALALGADANGGFAVPFQLDPTVIWTSAGVINPLRQISRVETIVGKEWQGILSSGTSVTRAAEAAEVGDNSFTLTQPVVRTNRVQGFVPFSYELAESWTAVRSEITNALADAKEREEATSFVLGTGVTPAANGIIQTLSANTVGATTGQSFTAKDVYALEEALDPRYRTGEAKFLAHRGIYNKIRQFDTAGGAQLWERIGAGMPSQLLGYSSYESSVMANATTTGTKFLLYGDFRNFLIVDRVGMSVELIPQIFGAAQRPTGQRGIYATWMNNSKILVDIAFKVLIGVA